MSGWLKERILWTTDTLYLTVSGKGILLGLEILVAGDIIATVVTEPTMERVLILAVIVLIRTFLSLSIEVEIEGKFPWKNGPAPPRTLDQA